MIPWSKKVPQELISRLYNQSVSGICDDELVDEIGFALYARCKSIVSVTNGFEEKLLTCPNCDAEIPLTNHMFSCACGFHATWEEFRKSYKDKQLYAANALPIFTNFIKNFPKAKTYGEKLAVIDVLIHSFHINGAYHNNFANTDPEDASVCFNRPTGTNLIEGSMSEVIQFLDRLSSIEGYSQGKNQWRSIMERAQGGHALNSGTASS